MDSSEYQRGFTEGFERGFTRALTALFEKVVVARTENHDEPVPNGVYL